MTLQGSVVRRRRECTRDDEWRLMVLSLDALEHGSTCQQVHTLAECRGGDAIQLHAPVEMHGEEGWELTDLLPGEPAVSLTFVCETLLVCNNAHVWPMMIFDNELCVRDCCMSHHAYVALFAWWQAARFMCQKCRLWLIHTWSSDNHHSNALSEARCLHKTNLMMRPMIGVSSTTSGWLLQAAIFRACFRALSQY